jgi:hypothetical protein
MIGEVVFGAEILWTPLSTRKTAETSARSPDARFP